MLEAGSRDQAEGLRRLIRPGGLRVLPVAGGGNANERSIAVAGLAEALAKTGVSVVVLDQSGGGAARALGLASKFELLHLLDGDKTFGEVAVDCPEGARLVSAARGLARLAEEGGHGESLFGAFARIERPAQIVILSIESAEIAGRVLPQGNGEVLLVASPSTESITQAYADVKRLTRARGLTNYRVLVCGAEDASHGEQVVSHMAGVAKRFLGARLSLAGVTCIPPRNRPMSAELAVGRIAIRLSEWRLIELASGSEQFH